MNNTYYYLINKFYSEIILTVYMLHTTTLFYEMNKTSIYVGYISSEKYRNEGRCDTQS